MIILVSHTDPTLYSCVESSLCSVISTSSGAVTHSGGELYKAEIPMIGYLWNVTPLTSSTDGLPERIVQDYDKEEGG